MAAEKQKTVLTRERIERTALTYFRKVWDDGTVDTYIRYEPQKIQRRGPRRVPITQAEWDEQAAVGPVIS